MSVPRYGTPEWKPISETRKSRMYVKYEAYCAGCGYAIGTSDNKSEIQHKMATHDAGHSDNYAECCMHSDRHVCASVGTY